MVKVQLLNLHLPLNTVTHAPVLDGHGQVASLVEAPKLGVGGVVSDEKSTGFGHFDGLALLDACARMTRRRGPTKTTTSTIVITAVITSEEEHSTCDCVSHLLPETSWHLQGPAHGLDGSFFENPLTATCEWRGRRIALSPSSNCRHAY